MTKDKEEDNTIDNTLANTIAKAITKANTIINTKAQPELPLRILRISTYISGSLLKSKFGWGKTVTEDRLQWNNDGNWVDIPVAHDHRSVYSLESKSTLANTSDRFCI